MGKRVQNWKTVTVDRVRWRSVLLRSSGEDEWMKIKYEGELKIAPDSKDDALVKEINQPI